MKRHSLTALSLFAVALLAACGGGKDTPTAQSAVAGAEALATGPSTRGVTALGGASLDASLRRASGPVEVWVALDQNSLARTRAVLAATTGVQRVRALSSPAGEGAKRAESAVIATAMASQRSSILAQQAAMSSRLSSLGAKELARVSVAHNAIAITVDASQLPQIITLPGVKSIRPVVHYEMHLGSTVPYIGGTAAQALGFDGTGVRVAVLDSGIDYTHKNLGGAGTAAAYEAAWGTLPSTPDKATTRDGLFPTAKVVDGFDFVGEVWPNGDRTEDDDPIDFEGHGTHVADIIAGQSADGTHKGVAPGAKLVAVKVCSPVASSCNGIALLKGMDFALDPNGDGDLSDAVDVINMSLGSSYGQDLDDLSGASANAVALGVTVVASAGNSADRPFITGSPASTPGVISVAQTQVPSATTIPLVISAPPAIAGTYANTALLDWAPINTAVTADVVFMGRGCIGDPVLADPAGKIALIDRGFCNISEKVDTAANLGATGVLIGLVAGGDAVSFSLGNGSNFVPSMVIQQSLSNAIKTQRNAGTTVTASLSPANGISIVGSMVGSSSRGPNVSAGRIKPEIGAPGASVSAVATSGDGQGAFGGTSGAAPMVSGAAALLLSANPSLSPMQVKALLMNSAETTIYTNPATLPGVLAPITRIGAGEVRVDRALAQQSLAWDQETLSASLSYGVLEAEKQTVVQRTLRIENLGNTAKQFTVSTSFRYADDAASGAVKVQPAGNVVNVPANGSATLKVSLLINPTKLPTWGLNGGSLGGTGALLNGPEYDGYVTLTAGAEKISVPWHVLPRKAAKTAAAPYNPGRNAGNLLLVNTGATAGGFDTFSLLGTSGQFPASDQPGPGDNFALVDLKGFGARVSGTTIQFAISTHGRRAHPLYPGGFEVQIDNNGDGNPDFFVYQAENGTFASSGQSVVFVQAAGASTASAFFFNNADLNSGTMIFTVPAAAIGATPGTTLGLTVLAYDNYFTGIVTDVIEGAKFTPGQTRFTTGGGFVPVGSSLQVPVAQTAVSSDLSTELGLMLLYRTNAGAESQEIPIAAPVAPAAARGN
jgi:minor extracellular serine protease Vpr